MFFSNPQLREAIEERNLAEVSRFLDDLLDEDNKQPHWRAILNHALVIKWRELASLLIDRGADISINPIELVKEASHSHEMLQLLKKKGLCLRHEDIQGQTFLFELFPGTGHREADCAEMELIVKTLMQLGIQIDARDPYDGGTALYSSLALDYEDYARVLIHCGAAVDIGLWEKSETDCGRTPLQYAVVGNSYELFLDMITVPMNINARDYEGATALHHVASCHGVIRYASQKIRLLVEKGADVDARDLCNYTPLTYASKAEAVDLSVIELLIELGADPRAKVGIAPCKPLPEVIMENQYGNIDPHVIELFKKYV